MPTPVRPSYGGADLRRAVHGKLEDFHDPRKQQEILGQGVLKQGERQLRMAISSVAGNDNVLYAVNAGTGRLRPGEVAAVCYRGSKGTIRLYVFYCIAEGSWRQYNYILFRRDNGTVFWQESR